MLSVHKKERKRENVTQNGGPYPAISYPEIQK